MVILPKNIETRKQLEEIMTRPSPELVRFMAGLKGDLLILGVSGKMGPTLAKLSRRAIDAAGVEKKVIGAARFSSPETRQELADCGIETISCDLFNPKELEKLPNVPNVFFLVGTKFGTTGNETLTWAVNAYLPGLVAEKFKKSSVVVLSTGSVYPLTSVASTGSKETDTPVPIGEYAQSGLARERVFEYFSKRFKIPMAFIRLFYAIDLRYGVLLDIARKVAAGIPVDLTMGYVNFIWQGDANDHILRALNLSQTPPKILNLTGTEKISVRQVTEKFGELLGKKPVFKNEEAATAFLADTGEMVQHLGTPKISAEQMIQWVAHWVKINGPTLNKPTHFEKRNGKF